MNATAASSPARFVSRALLLAATLAACAAGGAYWGGGAEAALSVGVGAAIAMASFAVLALVLVRTIAGGRGAGWVAALGIVKMGVIGAVLWWLLSRKVVEPLAFLGGFSTMVAALLLEGLRTKR